MNNRIKLLFLTVIFVTVSCVQLTNKCLITNDLLLSSQAEKVFTVDNNDGFPDDICDRGTDSINMVGYYSFYRTGVLKSYTFFSCGDTFTYKEEYDSLGNRINMKGTPMVFRDLNAITKDSYVFKEYFFNLNRNFDPFIAVTFNNKSTEMIKLEEDSLRSNILFFKVYLNASGLNKIQIATSVKFTDLCNEKTQTAVDTTVYFR